MRKVRQETGLAVRSRKEISAEGVRPQNGGVRRRGRKEASFSWTTLANELAQNALELKSRKHLEFFVRAQNDQLTELKRVLEREIAKREGAEEALRRAEQKYRSIFEDAVVGIFQSTPEGRYISMNATRARTYGYDSPEEAIENIDDIATQIYVDPSRRDEFRRILEEQGEVREFEHEARRRDGTRIWISTSARVVRDANGKVLYYEGTAEDITRRKRAEEALRRSEEDYRSMFENAVGGICRWTVDGRFLKVNPALVKMLGYDSDEDLLKLSIPTEVYFDTRDYLEHQRMIVERDKVSNHELRLRKKDGQLIYVNVNDRIQRDEAGKILYYETTIEDMTARKITEEALRQAHTELEMRVRERTAELARANEELTEYQQQLRLAASELSLLQEEERRKMATSLHDTIGQALAVARIKLKGLQQAVSSNGVSGLTAEILELIEFAIHQTRSLTYDLSPPILYEVGIEAAIEWLAEQMGEKNDLKVVCQNDGQAKCLDDDVRVVLFQVVRELLHNVVKHAQADSVKIWSRREADVLCVDVEDDGIGFDASQVFSYQSRHGGYGLFSVREQLKHLGGRIDVKSERGSGTKVTIHAPLKVEPKDKLAESTWR